MKPPCMPKYLLFKLSIVSTYRSLQQPNPSDHSSPLVNIVSFHNYRCAVDVILLKQDDSIMAYIPDDVEQKLIQDKVIFLSKEAGLDQLEDIHIPTSTDPILIFHFHYTGGLTLAELLDGQQII